MKYQDGYKVAYEVAANGERAIYASKSNVYPTDADDCLAKFADADIKGKTVYEGKGTQKGDFFVADTNSAKFDKDGIATGAPLADLNKLEKNEEVTTNDEPKQEEPKQENIDNGDEGLNDEGVGE